MYENLFRQALNIDDLWQLTNIDFNPDGERIDIYLDFAHGTKFKCPVCNKPDWIAPKITDIWLSNKNLLGVRMKKRRTYTREFKLKVLRECENGKGKAQLSHEHGLIHLLS